MQLSFVMVFPLFSYFFSIKTDRDWFYQFNIGVSLARGILSNIFYPVSTLVIKLQKLVYLSLFMLHPV